MDNCTWGTELDIRLAALSHGIPQDYMVTMANIESSCNSSAVNKHTGATGLFQFLPKAAKDTHLNLSDRTDSLKSSFAAAEYTKQNLSTLRKMGIPVNLNSNPEYGYLAHQQGASGLAQIILAANNGTDVNNSIRKNMDQNGGKGKTPKEFLEFWKKHYQQIAAGGKPHSK